MNWAASVIPSENSPRKRELNRIRKDLGYRIGIWDTQEVVGFPYLDIFKKIVGGSLSGTVCKQSCLETRSELDQRVLSCLQWHPRKQVPHASLVFCPLCAERPSSGHLPWWVRRTHEDRTLPATEVRAEPGGAGTRWVLYRKGTPGSWPELPTAPRIRGTGLTLSLTHTCICQLPDRLLELLTQKNFISQFIDKDMEALRGGMEPDPTWTGDSLGLPATKLSELSSTLCQLFQLWFPWICTRV